MGAICPMCNKRVKLTRRGAFLKHYAPKCRWSPCGFSGHPASQTAIAEAAQ